MLTGIPCCKPPWLVPLGAFTRGRTWFLRSRTPVPRCPSREVTDTALVSGSPEGRATGAIRAHWRVLMFQQRDFGSSCKSGRALFRRGRPGLGRGSLRRKRLLRKKKSCAVHGTGRILPPNPRAPFQERRDARATSAALAWQQATLL